MRAPPTIAGLLLLALASSGRAVSGQDPPADPATEARAAEARKRKELDERRARLPDTSRGAMALLDRFRDKEFRLWRTLRRDVLAQGREALPALSIAIEEPDWEMRAFSASCLGALGDPAGVPTLVRAFAGEKVGEARRQHAVALAELATPEAAAALVEAAESDEVGLRVAGVRGLGRILDPAHAEVLRRSRAHEDLDVRYEALGALGALREKEVVDALLAEAEAVVADRAWLRMPSKEDRDDGDRYRQYLLGLALARCDDPRVDRLLLAVVLAEKPWQAKAFLRMGAAEGLGRRAAARGEPLEKRVVAGFQDDDRTVRMACAFAAGWSRSEDLVPGLSRLLADSQLDVAHNAVVALGRIGTPDAAKALRRAVSDKADEIRMGAVRALSAIPGPEATRSLVQAARDEKYMVRVLAVRALAHRTAEPGALEALGRARTDADYGVREQAVAALSRHPDPAAVVEPLTAALGDADVGVRANACLGLARLRDHPPVAADAALAGRMVHLAVLAKEERVARAAQEFLDAVRPPAAFEALLAGLTDDALEARRRADATLRRLAEAAVDYRPDAEPGERAAGVARWRAWWEARGRRFDRRAAASRLQVTGATEEETKRARDLKWRGLDVVLLLDSTGSMAGLIRAAKERIDEVVEEMAGLVPSLRVSVYTYRDHGDDYLYYGTPLTFDTWKLHGFLQNAVHGQGGDIPEAVYETVLNATTSLRWRPDAQKVVVYAGDAPHHPDQEGDLLSRVKAWFTAERRAELHAVMTDTSRRSLDVKSRKRRETSTKVRVPVLESYAKVAAAGRGRAILLDDESALTVNLLVAAMGEPWRADVENLLAFEQ